MSDLKFLSFRYYLLGLLGCFLILSAVPGSDSTALMRSIKVEKIRPELGLAYAGSLGDPELSSHEKALTGKLYYTDMSPISIGKTLSNNMSWSRIGEYAGKLIDRKLHNVSKEKEILISEGGNSPHQDIRTEGGGLFSIWKGTLYFSMPSEVKKYTGQDVTLYLPTPKFAMKQKARLILKFAIALLLIMLVVEIIIFFAPTLVKLLPSPLRKTDRLKSISSNLFIGLGMGLVTFGLIFGVSEIYLRKVKNATFSANDTYRPSYHNPDVGFIFEASDVMQYSNGMDFWIKDRTNNIGFVDNDFVVPKPPNQIRIQLVGDSFVEALQVTVDKKSQTVLEARLKDTYPDLDIDVIATGYSGTGQANQLPFYTHFKEQIKPDIVILLFVGNDFANNSPLIESIRYGWHPNHLPRLFYRPSGELRPIAADWFEKRLSATTEYGRVRELRSLSPEYKEILAEWEPDTNLDHTYWEKDLPKVFKDSLPATLHALRAWKDLSERDGFELFIASVPGAGVRSPYYSPKFKPLIDTLSEIAEQVDIPVYDLTDAMLGDSSFGSLRFRYDAHWNEKGHRKAGEALAEYLKDQKIIESVHAKMNPDQ